MLFEKIRNIRTSNLYLSTKYGFLNYLNTKIVFWKGEEEKAITDILSCFPSNKYDSMSDEMIKDFEIMVNRFEIILEESLETLSENFSEFFKEYMKKNVIPKIQKIQTNKKIQDLFKEADHVLTFNYTNVHKLYGVNDALTIHGEIEGEKPLIMGFYHKTNIDNKEEEDDHLERHDGRLFSKDTVYYKLNGEDI